MEDRRGQTNTTCTTNTKLMMTAALGRPFQLGMLYDCRTDTLVTGLSLWDHKTLDPAAEQDERIVHRERIENSSVHLITGDSLDDKTKHMDISAEGKLGIMSGLVDVSGSAKYLNDTKSSQKQSRVSLYYQSTSELRSVDIKLDGLMEHSQLGEAIKLNIATHVVTGILYGADAVFVFDHMIDKSSTKSELQVQGEMKVAIKKLQIDAKAEMHLSVDESTTKDNLSCTFYGDVILEDLPTTFTEARTAYQKVIETIGIGKESEKVVPKKVWLLPLNALRKDGRSTVTRSISDTTVENVHLVIKEFQLLKVKATDIKTTYSFPPFSDYLQLQLDSFLSTLDTRCNELMTQIKVLLPQIRSGTSDENELHAILSKSLSPPFNSNIPMDWLAAKKNEAETLKSLSSLVKGIEIAATPGQFNSILIDTPWKYLLVLEFNLPNVSLVDDMHVIPQILEIDNYHQISDLDSNEDRSIPQDVSRPLATQSQAQPRNTTKARKIVKSIGRITKEFVGVPMGVQQPHSQLPVAGNDSHWYMSPELVLTQKSLVKRFADFSHVDYNKDNEKVKFAVTLVQCKRNESAQRKLVSLKLYRKDDGKADETVVIPSKPRKLKYFIDTAAQSLTVKWEEPKHGGTKDMTYTVTLSNEITKKSVVKMSDSSSMMENFVDLTLNQKYTVSVQANLVVTSLTGQADPQPSNQEATPNPVVAHHVIGLSEKKEKSFVFKQ